MAVTNFSPLLGLALPTTGDLSGTWGTTVNDSITGLLDSAVAGTTTLSTDADVTLTTTNGAANQARNAVLLCTGARTTLKTITAPAQSKAYIVINATTGGFSVKVVGSGPTTPGVTVANGEKALIAWNGSDFVLISKSVIDLTADVKGILPVANGGTGQTSYTDGQLLIGNSSGNTLTKATLTQGSGITITNGNGAITIAASGSGVSAATPTALGTVYGKQTTVGGTPFLTAYGYNAAGGTTGVGVTAVGVGALYTNSTGARSTAMGYNAGYSNTGDNNLFVGNQSGFTNTTGTGNSFVGGMTSDNWPSGYYNTTGADNSAFGGGTLIQNTTGSSNTAVGTYALYSNTTASGITAVGYQAGKNNTTGTANVYMGYNAGRANTTGNYNIGIGREALDATTTASSNVGIGYYAVGSNTTGESNTGVGREAISSNTTGTNNTALGHQALTTNTTGTHNTGIGREALKTNSSSSYNTGVGSRALSDCTTGESNATLGYDAGKNITTGSYNTILGVAMGSYGTNLTTGNYNTLIGYSSGVSSASVSGEMLICSGSFGFVGKGGNTGFISPNGGAMYNGGNTTTWTTTSDRRLKKNIVNHNIGLEKLAQIQVRNFEYRLPEEVDAELKPSDAIKKTGVQLGVIAQELQAVLPECVKTESTGVMSVDADNLTWYMINAIKELKAEVDSLKSQLQGN